MDGRTGMSKTKFVTFALCLVQEETVQTDFCHESVRKQQVWLMRNRGSCVRDADGDTESDRYGKF